MTQHKERHARLREVLEDWQSLADGLDGSGVSAREKRDVFVEVETLRRCLSEADRPTGPYQPYDAETRTPREDALAAQVETLTAELSSRADQVDSLQQTLDEITVVLKGGYVAYGELPRKVEALTQERDGLSRENFRRKRNE